MVWPKTRRGWAYGGNWFAGVTTEWLLTGHQPGKRERVEHHPMSVKVVGYVGARAHVPVYEIEPNHLELIESRPLRALGRSLARSAARPMRKIRSRTLSKKRIGARQKLLGIPKP